MSILYTILIGVALYLAFLIGNRLGVRAGKDEKKWESKMDDPYEKSHYVFDKNIKTLKERINNFGKAIPTDDIDLINTSKSELVDIIDKMYLERSNDLKILGHTKAKKN